MTGDEEVRIMVVDDEEDLLSVIEMLLEACGWKQIEKFSNPFEALEHFKKKNSSDNLPLKSYYSLVLSDIRMPGMNGFELASEMLKINSEAKIVLMSAFELDKKMQDMLPVIKCEELLYKPFALDQLCNIIRKKLS